jgi:hypothetical protein
MSRIQIYKHNLSFQNTTPPTPMLLPARKEAKGQLGAMKLRQPSDQPSFAICFFVF